MKKRCRTCAHDNCCKRCEILCVNCLADTIEGNYDHPSWKPKETKQKKAEAKNALGVIARYIIAFAVVGIVWQLLELLMYGEIQPRAVDTVVGTALAYSITLNTIKVDDWFSMMRYKNSQEG